MSQGEGQDAPDSIDGLPLDDAVEVVLERDEASDRESVRTTLRQVTEDGEITQSAVADVLGEAALVVATAENRTELAERALSDARETASSVDDLDAVRSRLDQFEARVTAVEDRTVQLGSDLDSLRRRVDDPESVYEVAREMREVASEARDVQQTADVIQRDLDDFERWVGNPVVRFEELETDLDALESTLDELARTVDDLVEMTERRSADDGAEPATDDPDDLGAAWFDATVQQRTRTLVLADVRAEFEDLATWFEREATAVEDQETDVDEQDPDADGRNDDVEKLVEAQQLGVDIVPRIEHLKTRAETLGDRLQGFAHQQPEWRDRFEAQLTAIDAMVDDIEPPVDWASVQAEIDAIRTREQ